MEPVGGGAAGSGGSLRVPPSFLLFLPAASGPPGLVLSRAGRGLPPPRGRGSRASLVSLAWGQGLDVGLSNRLAPGTAHCPARAPRGQAASMLPHRASSTAEAGPAVSGRAGVWQCLRAMGWASGWLWLAQERGPLFPSLQEDKGSSWTGAGLWGCCPQWEMGRTWGSWVRQPVHPHGQWRLPCTMARSSAQLPKHQLS